MANLRSGSSEFLEKARAPMATEEFERSLRAEREYWSTIYQDQVSALEKAVSAVQQQAVADRAEQEALRASVCDLRAEGACASAAGAAKVALLEAAVSELREALHAEREQRRAELRKAEERHLAELATTRSAHEGALSVARQQADGGHVDKMIVALQSDVARLQSASAEQLQEPLQRLCRLSDDLDQTRDSVDSAHQRISELALGQAKATDRLSCLDDTQAQALAAQSGIREQLAQGSRQSNEDIRQTQELVLELQSEVRRLAESAKEQEKARQGTAGFDDLDCTMPSGEDEPRRSGPELRMHEEAIAELRVEVACLRTSAVEQARREELAAQKADRGVVELRAGLDRLQEGLARAERRLDEMAEAGRGAAAESGPAASDDGVGARVDSLQRLVQDQRRELSMLSVELSSMRESHASDADRSQQAFGAIQSFMEEEQSRRAGLPGAVGQERHQPRAVCERVAEIESRMAASLGRQQEEADAPAEPPPPTPREALPTLLAGGSIADAEAARVAASLKDSLKDSLQGVMFAVQKALQEEDAQPQQQRRTPTAAVSLVQAVPAAARQQLAAPPAWHVQRLVAPAVAQPARVHAPVAVGPQRPRGGSVQLAPGTPLLVRRG